MSLSRHVHGIVFGKPSNKGFGGSSGIGWVPRLSFLLGVFFYKGFELVCSRWLGSLLDGWMNGWVGRFCVVFVVGAMGPVIGDHGAA